MKLLPLLVIALTCTAALFPSGNQPDNFTLPAEFDFQQAVWMSARPTETGKPVLDIVIEMMRALAPHVHIQLMVPNEDIKADVHKRLRQQNIDERQISFWTTHDSPTRWYRDVGAIFLRNSRGDLRAVDFNFNCYGECALGSLDAQKKEGVDRDNWRY
jgi:agmatine deiminase